MSQGIQEIVDLANQIESKSWGPLEKDRVFWDIITCLRGPDTDNQALKKKSTERLRHVICPQLAGSNGATQSDGPIEEVEYSKAEWHFLSHYNKAVTALNKLGEK